MLALRRVFIFKVSIARGRLHLYVPQQLADHR